MQSDSQRGMGGKRKWVILETFYLFVFLDLGWMNTAYSKKGQNYKTLDLGFILKEHKA